MFFILLLFNFQHCKCNNKLWNKKIKIFIKGKYPLFYKIKKDFKLPNKKNRETI